MGRRVPPTAPGSRAAHRPDAEHQAGAKEARAVTQRCIDSRELLGDGQEVHIAHDGHRYRLRVTALGKLILTK